LDAGVKTRTGTPFSTYGAGHEALGLRAGSRAITFGRYIDTGKMYKGRYTFYSCLATGLSVEG
jgi:hypothetical protein